MVKKILSFTLALMVSVSMFAGVVFADAWVWDNWDNYDGTVKSNGLMIPRPLFYKDFINGSGDPGTSVYGNGFFPAKTGREYGSTAGNKFALDFARTPTFETTTPGVYQLDVKAYYNGPAIGFTLDVDFDEDKYEICAPDGTSVTTSELLENEWGSYKTPTMAKDWTARASELGLSAYTLGRSIRLAGEGWANVKRFDGHNDIIDLEYTIDSLFASNDVSRIDDAGHVGNFTIDYQTRIDVNSRLNSADVRDRLWFDELMCPTDAQGKRIGLSLGTVYFKLKSGVEESELDPTDFTRDGQTASYLHKTFNPIPVASSVSFSGADVVQRYNDSNALAYAANLEVTVLGEKHTEPHSGSELVTKEQLNIHNTSRMVDDNVKQPDPYGETGVGTVTLTKYYKQLNSEAPPLDPSDSSWIVAVDGKLPNTGGVGTYFLMVDVGDDGDLYSDAQDIILDQTFKILPSQKAGLGQLVFGGSTNRTYDNTAKQPSVEETELGMGTPKIVGYKLTTSGSWTDVTSLDPTKPIPNFTDAGVYNLRVSIPEGSKWHGTAWDNTAQAVGVDNPIVLNEKFTITPKAITASFTGLAKTFDNTTAIGSEVLGTPITLKSVNGCVNNEELTATIKGGTWASKYVGTGIAITCNPSTQIQLDDKAGNGSTINDGKASNYTLSAVTATGSITAKEFGAGDVTVTQPDGTAGRPLPTPTVTGDMGLKKKTQYKKAGDPDEEEYWSETPPTDPGDYIVKVTIDADQDGDGTDDVTGELSTIDEFTINPPNLEIPKAPAAPELQGKSTTSITLDPSIYPAVSGYKIQYSKDGGAWQDSNTFTGLKVFTIYSFKARYKEISGEGASPASAATKIRTARQGWNPFSDVYGGKSTWDEGAPWYYNAVQFMYDNKLTSGTNGGKTYSPNASLSRRAYVTFLWRLDGSPKTKYTTPFKDVSNSAKDDMSVAIRWAYNKKITSGMTKTTFAPMANVSRQAMSAFTYRYQTMTKKVPKDIPAKVTEYTKVTDKNKINPALALSVQKCFYQGQLRLSGTKVNPTAGATRADVAYANYYFLTGIGWTK